MTQETLETPISSLEATIDQLFIKLDSLRAENQALRKQLATQQQLADDFSNKNSQASQAIQRLMTRMEKEA